MCNNANKNLVIRNTRPEHIKSIVSSIIFKIKEKDGKNKKLKIKEYIIKILGRQSERYIKMCELRKGCLCIGVDSSAWLQELNLIKQDLLNKVNMKFKRDIIKEIKIRLSKK